MKKKVKEDIEPLQPLSREDALTSIVLSALTLMVYSFTAAPGVTMEDSGDFINGVLTLGIVHPPGYPLYTVLGHLFTYLPLGEPAYRVNLFSALWGALCLGVVFLNLRILSIDRIHAVFATLFLGFTFVFWSNTAIAEVYSLNGFLIACIVLAILSYNRDKKKSQLYLVFLTTGLALTNHYPLVILTGLGLVFLLDRRGLRAGDFFKGLLFLGLGLTPYLYLFIQASNPELQYSFGKPSTFGMVLDHIARSYYAIDYGGTVWEKFLLALFFLKAIMTNFLFATVFLFWGLILSLREKRRYRYPFLIAALSPSLGLILVLTMKSDEVYETAFLAFLTPSFLFLSVFLAAGLKPLMSRWVKNKLVQVSLLVLVLLSQAGFNFRDSSHHNDRLVETWGAELLNSLEADSVLILCGWGMPLYYLQLTKGLRRDVTLYDRFSLMTKENLYEPRLVYKYGTGDRVQIRKSREQQLINESLRPIYYTCKEVPDGQKFASSLTPFAYRVDKRHAEAWNGAEVAASDRLLHLLVNGYPKSEYWLDRVRQTIFGRLISYYGGHKRPEINSILNHFRESKFYSDPGLNLSLAKNLYFFQNYELARKFYERAEELSLQAFSGRDLAVFCHILAKAKSYDKALGICLRQERSSPPCEVNTVKTRLTIADIYQSQGNWPKVAKYSRKILECQPGNETAQRYVKLAAERKHNRE